MQNSSNNLCALLNIEAEPSLQWIEIASSFQIPAFHVVGLPAPEVAESRERVRAAIEASGFQFPKRRVVLNLSPASVRKRGTGTDLAMALAVLSTQEEVETRALAWGELGLDGKLKPAGQITRALFAAWKERVPLVIVSTAEEEETRATAQQLRESGEFAWELPRIAAATDLLGAWEVLKAGPAAVSSEPLAQATPPDPELKDAELLPLAPAVERVLCVAAAGGHHLLLLGPRGTGKSHAFEWLVALQPPLPRSVALRQALFRELIRESAGQSESRPRAEERRYRRVSAQVRPAALIGSAGEQGIRPGEFSLAHGGILLADEFPEWPRDAREAFREPLERGVITLTRARGSLEMPAAFQLAANGNLCPCGGWPPEVPLPPRAGGARSAARRCRCRIPVRRAYLAKISGPLLDRIDLSLVLNALPESSRPGLGAERLGELRERVAQCRALLVEAWGEIPSRLPATKIEELLNTRQIDAPALSTLESLRSRHKVARLALTLAAWDGAPVPKPAHIAEAMCYRPERLGLA